MRYLVIETGLEEKEEFDPQPHVLADGSGDESAVAPRSCVRPGN